MQEPAAPSSISRSARSARFFNLLHRYKNLLLKHWWVLPVGLVLGLAVQGFRIWMAPPLFASVGRMIVAIRINAPIGASYMEEFTQFLGTQAALMKSATVQEKARERVRALKPNLTPVEVELQISVSPKTTIFNLQGIGADADYIRAYVDACMDEFLLLKKDMRTSTSDTTLAGLTAQLASLEADLKKYDEEEMNFKTTNNVQAVQEADNYAAKYLAQLNGQLAQLKTEYQLLTLLDLDQNLAREQKATTLPASAGDDSKQGNTPINLINNDYFKAKQELQMWRAELVERAEYLKPKHPRMIWLNEEIARREKLLEVFKENSLEALEIRRKSIKLQIENLDAQITEWETKSLEVSKKLSDYERIRAGKLRVQTQYDRLLAAMKSIDVDKDVSPESVNIYERASRAEPVRANPVATLSIGAMLGLLVAAAILLLVDRLDDRPSSFADLQDVFDEPVLGQIPLQQNPNRNGAVKLLQPDDQRHALLEAYRNLRSSLLYMAGEGKRPRVILVTSAIPGDGKSMTAANFAIIMALSGSRVVLVDADLRKGLLHRHFGIESTPGLSEVLLGEADWRKTIRTTSIDKLSVLPRGNTGRNPGEMLLSNTSLNLIKELSAEFDYVIYDTAPVMAADDVTSLSPHVEGVIFVIRAGYTSGRVARAALDMLYQREVSVLGLAFNGVRANASEYYYYRYKDYYHDEKAS